MGTRQIGYGTLLTAADRLGNNVADRLAKEAVQEHRVSAYIRRAIADQEQQVTAMVWWIARVTIAANAWGQHKLLDSESAPRRHGPREPGRLCARRGVKWIRVALGGHDIACTQLHLARP